MPGDEHCMALHKMHIRDTHAVILVYDRSDPETMKSIDSWMNAVLEVAPTDTQLIFCGNKADVRKNHVVPLSEG